MRGSSRQWCMGAIPTLLVARAGPRRRRGGSTSCGVVSSTARSRWYDYYCTTATTIILLLLLLLLRLRLRLCSSSGGGGGGSSVAATTTVLLPCFSGGRDGREAHSTRVLVYRVTARTRVDEVNIDLRCELFDGKAYCISWLRPPRANLPEAFRVNLWPS